jgi:hypothetical protein
MLHNNSILARSSRAGNWAFFQSARRKFSDAKSIPTISNIFRTTANRIGPRYDGLEQNALAVAMKEIRVGKGDCFAR